MKTQIFLHGKLVEEIDTRSLVECVDFNIKRIKQIATETIQSAGLDEATQINAIAGIYPPERCEAIKSYIAACRNEYLRCKELILAATTNDEADGVKFNYPNGQL